MDASNEYQTALNPILRGKDLARLRGQLMLPVAAKSCFKLHHQRELAIAEPLDKAMILKGNHKLSDGVPDLSRRYSSRGP